RELTGNANVNVIWSTAPPPPPPSPPSPRSGYWMVGTDGKVYAFGASAALVDAPLPGSTTATNLASTPSGNGYWVINNVGNVYAFGDAPFLGGGPALGKGEQVTSISPTP